MEPPAEAAFAFVCAMPMELEPLVPLLGLAETSVGSPPLQRGALGGRPVVGIVTGMGTAFATEGVIALLDAVRVGHVVVVGITGAVENDTPIGTLVRPVAVIDGASGDRFRPDPLGAPDATEPRAGAMWTADELITDLDRIAGLRRQGVVCLDMETAATARVCEDRGVPWSVFRVISDRATDGTLSEEIFQLSNLDGTPNTEAIERFFAEHPEQLDTMAQRAEGATLAARTAAEAAVSACSAAGAPA